MVFSIYCINVFNALIMEVYKHPQGYGDCPGKYAQVNPPSLNPHLLVGMEFKLANQISYCDESREMVVISCIVSMNIIIWVLTTSRNV